MSSTVVGFAPFFAPDSKVLILGSFPSVKSREQAFYYGHPQNAFWRILSSFFGEDKPISIEEKKSLLLRRKIALWDIVTECEIVGSADATIKNFKVAPLNAVLDNAPIKYILVNGKRAFSIFSKYCNKVALPCICLPSTSPANAVKKDDIWYDALRRALGEA